MRRGALLDDQRGFAHALHHARDKTLHRRDVGRDRGRIAQRGRGKENGGNGGKQQAAHWGSVVLPYNISPA